MAARDRSRRCRIEASLIAREAGADAGWHYSPAGLVAWIVEKFRTWSDCHGDVESTFTKDRLLENITLYWVTGTVNSAMRLYYEGAGPGRSPTSIPQVRVPTGYAHFPAEIRPTPRLWVEQVFTNIVRGTEMPKGGHFAAFEQPRSFVEELRTFARPYRSLTEPSES